MRGLFLINYADREHNNEPMALYISYAPRKQGAVYNCACASATRPEVFVELKERVK